MLLSFLALTEHKSRQSKAHIRFLSTFFIGSSIAVMDYCPQVGSPEKTINSFMISTEFTHAYPSSELTERVTVCYPIKNVDKNRI